MMKRGIIYFTPLREIGFTPASTLGKGTGSHGFWWAKVRPAIPSRGQPKQQGTFPLLPGGEGRDEGECSTNQILSHGINTESASFDIYIFLR
jgi:hypothetical protein